MLIQEDDFFNDPLFTLGISFVVGTVMIVIAIMGLGIYMKQKSKLLLYFFLSWAIFGVFLILSDGIAVFLGVMGESLLAVLLFRLSYAFIAPCCIIFFFAFIDEAMQEGLGMKKTIVAFVVCSIMGAFVIIVPFGFIPASSGSPAKIAPIVSDNIVNADLEFIWIQIVNIAFLLEGIAAIYWTINTFRKAPPSLKKNATILLSFGILMLIGLTIQFTADELLLMMQIVILIIVCLGTLLTIKKEPRIAHLLPYTVYKLIITSKNGPKYYTKSWAESGIDDDMLAGLMSAIGTVVKNTLQKIKTGAISEIKMYKGVMLTEMRYLPVNIVIVASKASGALKQSLEGFSEEFMKSFYNNLYDKDGFAKEVLDPSSTFTDAKMEPLIAKYFKNVAIFDTDIRGSELPGITASTGDSAVTSSP
nr:hypothetical protein [Candidatus Sigynarchaeota archaeon]